MPTPSRSFPRARPQSVIVAIVACAAAVGAAMAGAHPTGSAAADVVWAAAFGAIVPIATAKAHRRSWLWMVAVAMVAATGWVLVAAGAAVIAAVVGVTTKRRSKVLGAAIGAVTVQVLLRLPIDVFQGASALLAAASVAPVLVSGYRVTRRRSRKRIRRGLQALVAVGALVAIVFGVSMALAASDVTDGVASSRAALRLTRDGQTTEAKDQLRGSASQLGAADDLVNAPWTLPARAIPILGQHARALGTFVRDGTRLVRSAERSISAVDYDRMEYDSGRFDLARIRNAQQPLADAASAAAQADDDLRSIDRAWLLPQLQDRIDSYRDEISDARRDASLASQAAQVTPGLLGGDGERHYFIAFVTPAELRGSGGFIGSYGELTATNGRVRLTRSGPVSDLLKATQLTNPTLTGPPDYLARYGVYNPASHFQDVTLSPDFPSVAQVIEELYPQAGGGRLDGVLQVDPYGLAALLKITGPIDVDGLPDRLTAKNAADVLLRDQYRLFSDDGRQDDALANAAKATFEKLTTGSLPSPRELSRALDPMVRQGRFKFQSTHADEQRLVSQIGLAWAMPTPSPDDDLVAVTTQNNGNSKIDVFLQRAIDYDVKIDPQTATIDATATVTLHNSSPASGLPDVVIGNTKHLPFGTNRMWLTLYSPLDLTDADLDGFTIDPTRDLERGYHAYGTFLNVGPGQTVKVRFTLHGRINHPSRYHLDLFPQPTVNPDQVTVTVDGGPNTRPSPAYGLQRHGTSVSGTFPLVEQRRLSSSFRPSRR